MTIDETWKNCLAMWKWIAGQVHHPYFSVSFLKSEWLRKNGFESYTINEDCFFCDYDKRGCRDCPGVLVDVDFYCTKSEYSWNKHPILFYKKLVSLDKKRKQAT